MATLIIVPKCGTRNAEVLPSLAHIVTAERFDS